MYQSESQKLTKDQALVLILLVGGKTVGYFVTKKPFCMKDISTTFENAIVAASQTIRFEEEFKLTLEGPFIVDQTEEKLPPMFWKNPWIKTAAKMVKNKGMVYLPVEIKPNGNIAKMMPEGYEKKFVLDLFKESYYRFKANVLLQSALLCDLIMPIYETSDNK